MTERHTSIRTLLLLLIGAWGCARPVAPSSPPTGFRTVEGRGWSFAVPRDWAEVQAAPALVDVRERPTADTPRVVLLKRGRAPLAVRPVHQDTAAAAAAGVEPLGVRAGPGERTLERTSSTGSVGLTLQCTAPPERERVCQAILGTFRVEP